MLFDAAGGFVCEFATTSKTCALTGAAPYRVVTYVGPSDDPTGTSHLSVVDLAAEAGCTARRWARSARPHPSPAPARPTPARTATSSPAGAAGTYAARWTQAENNWLISLAAYDDDGGPVLSTTSSGLTWGTLAGATTYKVVVDGDPGALAGDYTASLVRVAGAPCPTLSTGDWSADASPLDFSDGSEVFCRTLGADAGDRLWWGSHGDETGGPGGVVLDSDGQFSCMIVGPGTYDDCLLAGTGPFRALVVSTPFTLQWTGTGGIGAFDLASTTGCTSLDATVSMASAPLAATLAGNDAVHCYLSGIAPDSAVALSLETEDGGTFASARVVHPDGTAACTSEPNGNATACSWSSGGADRVVVSSFVRALGDPAPYEVALRRLVEPAGCADLPQPSVATTVTGDLDSGIDIDCWAFDAAAGDHFSIEATRVSDGIELPSVLIDAADGGHRCDFFFGDCSDAEATSDGRHVVLVQNAGNAGDYELSVDCLTPACGPGAIEVTGAQPGRARDRRTHPPAGARPAPRPQLRLHPRARRHADRRACRSRSRRTAGPPSSTSTSPVPRWARGRSRWTPPRGCCTATNAVTLVAPVRGRLEPELVARGKYIAGREQTISVIVHNPGNVDAAGTPIFLAGLPTGTTITPLFDMWGGLTDATPASVVPFDPATMVADAGGTLIVPCCCRGWRPARPRRTTSRSPVRPAATTTSRCWSRTACCRRSAPRPAWMGGWGAGWGDDACTDALIDALLGSLLALLPGGPCVGTRLQHRPGDGEELRHRAAAGLGRLVHRCAGQQSRAAVLRRLGAPRRPDHLGCCSTAWRTW